MSGPASRSKELEAEIRRLPDLSLEDLRARWKALFGNPAPLSLRRRFLVRAIAYQMQVEAYGGLSASTEKRLQAIAAGVRQGNLDVAGIATTIRPGAQMLRQWKDQTHTVTALSDGFEWNGKTYKSLSAVAKKITGTNWNGYVFFGIKRPAPGNKNAAGPRAKPLTQTDATGRERNHG
jgi:ABC-type branched-subunit amino acid transport system substrate-binding protein